MSHFTVLVVGDDVDGQLAPFDENIEVERYEANSRDELIRKSREDVEWYRTHTYATYLADKDKYIVEHANNPAHIRYIVSAFAEKLTWTDEQHYADAIKYSEPGDINESGGEMSTYNPKSKWDWWVVGGRWDGGLITREGKPVNECRAGDLDIDATHVTFAVVKDGEWYERGHMGWWAVVTDAKPDDQWDTEWKALLADLPPDTALTLVDAHI